jgi:CheY-like chemotaxis protein
MPSIVDILIVHDNPKWRARLVELTEEEFTNHQVETVQEAFTRIERQFYYCALVDKSLVPGDGKDESGMRVLERLVNLGEGTSGLMLTAYGSIPSAKAALMQWKATDYIEQSELETQEGQLKFQKLVREMVGGARADYAKRYESGIVQLTATVDKGEYTVWVDSVLSAVGRGGGYGLLADFLDRLVWQIPPLIPFKPRVPPIIDKSSGVVEGSYWSKGLGEAVVIRFGRKQVLEDEKGKCAPERVVRYASHGLYGGLILKADLRFEDLPVTAPKA